jgi:hypothetical protein
MKRFRPFLSFLLWVFLAVALYLILIIGSHPFSGNDLIVERLVTGFWRFLGRNIPLISWNAATWGLGLGAFVLGVVLVHRWLASWAARTGRPWSWVTSFCLVALLPVLFVISFIVPGVLLQWEILREAVWINLTP